MQNYILTIVFDAYYQKVTTEFIFKQPSMPKYFSRRHFFVFSALYNINEMAAVRQKHIRYKSFLLVLCILSQPSRLLRDIR